LTRYLLSLAGIFTMRPARESVKLQFDNVGARLPSSDGRLVTPAPTGKTPQPTIYACQMRRFKETALRQGAQPPAAPDGGFPEDAGNR
jgi:hypothetical protein